MSKIATVLAFGTFDLLHPGHMYFLNQAARYGRVTIGLTPDRLCAHYKGQAPVHPFSTRRERLLKLSSVHAVVAANDRPGDFGVVARMAPDTIVLGYDQRLLAEALMKRLPQLRLAPRLVTVAPYRPEIYQSSQFRMIKLAAASVAPARCSYA